MSDLDHSGHELIDRARLTRSDARGDWPDVLRRAGHGRSRPNRLRIPTRGLLLAAALIVAIGAAAQAGALGPLGTYFSGSNAVAPKQKTDELQRVAASEIHMVVGDHRSTGDTDTATARAFIRLGKQLGPVHRIARLNTQQGRFTWFAAATSSGGYCINLYRDRSLFSDRCQTPPSGSAIGYVADTSRWGGGIVALQAALPRGVAELRVHVPGTGALDVRPHDHFAMVIFRDPGKPYSIEALGANGESLGLSRVNDPYCVNRKLLEPGFGACDGIIGATTGRTGTIISHTSANFGRGGPPAHIPLFRGFNAKCWLELQNDNLSPACKAAWERQHHPQSGG